jgi:hypothetical protein
MSFSELIPGSMVIISGAKKAMYIGPGHAGSFVFAELIGNENYRWLILQDQAYVTCDQSWGDEGKKQLATDEDVGSVVYDEDGHACLLVGVDCGPLKQCVVSYGGDTLGWTSECHVPDDQDKADAEYEGTEADYTGEIGCCNPECFQGACQGVTISGTGDMFSEFAKIFGAKLSGKGK